MSNPNDYAVGWICAISTEYVAAQSFLDERHDGPEYVSPNDNNDYSLGKIGKHNVVIAVLPDGEYGIASASSVARDMLHSFPNVRIGLMVGIGGGAPSQKHDIRLGDIVVSSPRDKKGGVFQYNFGNMVQGQSFRPTGFLNQPPMVLRTAVSGLRAQYESDGHRIDETINDIFQRKPRLRKKYQRPDRSRDRLYRSEVVHPIDDESDCTTACGDNSSNLVLRPERTADDDNPAIHYGLIASADQLVKDALFRDKLAAETDVLCFEMEAAGLMNQFPCLVIRGICDYSDTHKNKEWQGYAAMAAAAYAKDLLCRIPPNKVENEKKISELLSNVLDIASKTGTNVETMKSEYERDKDIRVLNWLTSIDHGPQQSDSLGRRQPETGRWLLESTEFQTWLETSKQTLFCPGIPGAGKTILTSIVVKELFTRFGNDEKIGIAYLYCDFQQRDKQVADDLAGLLKQLAQGRPSLPGSVKSLHDRHKDKRTRPSLDEISTVLQSVAAMYSRVFIIVDALDECQTNGYRSILLSHIFSLQANATTNVFATSRPILEIKREFEGRSAMLEISAKNEDVEKYLDGRMPELPLLGEKNQDVSKEAKEKFKDKIKTNIVEAVNGVFLLARLHLESLIDKTTPYDLNAALKTLPKGEHALTQAYGITIGRIRSQPNGYRFLAERVLSLLTCAERLLTTSELRDALAVRAGTPTLDENKRESISIVVSVCAGLVTVDENSGIIRLVHDTTREYLATHMFCINPQKEYTALEDPMEFNIQKNDTAVAEAHNNFTVICVTYLSFSIFESGFCETEEEFEERLRSNPFYDYAAQNWGRHTRKAILVDEQLILNFLSSSAKASASYQAIRAPRRRFEYEHSRFRQVSGLHLAAYLGLDELVLPLICGHDPNVMDTCQRTPLSWAAERGHDKVVRRLLAVEGIDPDRKGQRRFLHQSMIISDRWGAKHPDTERLLLNDHDGDRCGATPLWYAARNGHKSTVELLLAEHSINPDSEDETCRTTPLWCASGNGHETIVRLLLERKDVDADARDRKEGLTPLSIAAWRGCETVVKLLLAKAGVNPNSIDSGGQTPLMRAAYQGHSAVFELLLADKRVDPNFKDKKGWTPLLLAARKGHETIVKLLLAKNGVEVNVRDSSYGCTPLVWAVREGNMEVAKLLLADERVDPDPTESGWTPLLFAAAGGYDTLVNLLLNTNAVNPNFRDSDGWTPLMFAARYRHEAVMKLLLATNDVDLDAKSNSGSTPLLLAAGKGSEEVVRLLLDKGASIESSDNNGWTPLLWAVSNGHFGVFKLLLERGADIKPKDIKSRTPSLSDVEKCQERIAKLRQMSTPSCRDSDQGSG